MKFIYSIITLRSRIIEVEIGVILAKKHYVFSNFVEEYVRLN